MGYNAGMAHVAANLDRLFEPLSACLTPEAAKKLLAYRIHPEVEERLQSRADRGAEGELTPEERAEQQTYLSALNWMAKAQGRALLLSQTR